MYVGLLSSAQLSVLLCETRLIVFPFIALSLFFSSSCISTRTVCHRSRSQCCMFPALSGVPQITLKSVDLTKALMNGVLLAFYFSLPFKSAESFPVVHLVEWERVEKWGSRVRERNGREREEERERFFSSLAVVKRELARRLEVLRDRCLPFKALSAAGERNVASVEFMRPSRRVPLKRFVILYKHMHTGQLWLKRTHL